MRGKKEKEGMAISERVRKVEKEQKPKSLAGGTFTIIKDWDHFKV